MTPKSETATVHQTAISGLPYLLAAEFAGQLIHEKRVAHSNGIFGVCPQGDRALNRCTRGTCQNGAAA